MAPTPTPRTFLAEDDILHGPNGLLHGSPSPISLSLPDRSPVRSPIRQRQPRAQQLSTTRPIQQRLVRVPARTTPLTLLDGQWEPTKQHLRDSYRVETQLRDSIARNPPPAPDRVMSHPERYNPFDILPIYRSPTPPFEILPAKHRSPSPQGSPMSTDTCSPYSPPTSPESSPTHGNTSSLEELLLGITGPTRDTYDSACEAIGAAKKRLRQLGKQNLTKGRQNRRVNELRGIERHKKRIQSAMTNVNIEAAQQGRVKPFTALHFKNTAPNPAYVQKEVKLLERFTK